LDFFRGLFDGHGDQYNEREELIRQALSGLCSIKLIEFLTSKRPCVARYSINMFFYYGGGVLYHGMNDPCKIILGDSYQVLPGARLWIMVGPGSILKGIAIYRQN